MTDVLLGVISFVVILGWGLYAYTHTDGIAPARPLFGIYWDRDYLGDADD